MRVKLKTIMLELIEARQKNPRNNIKYLNLWAKIDWLKVLGLFGVCFSVDRFGVEIGGGGIVGKRGILFLEFEADRAKFTWRSGILKVSCKDCRFIKVNFLLIVILFYINPKAFIYINLQWITKFRKHQVITIVSPMMGEAFISSVHWMAWWLFLNQTR